MTTRAVEGAKLRPTGPWFQRSKEIHALIATLNLHDGALPDNGAFVLQVETVVQQTVSAQPTNLLQSFRAALFYGTEMRRATADLDAPQAVTMRADDAVIHEANAVVSPGGSLGAGRRVDTRTPKPDRPRQDRLDRAE